MPRVFELFVQSERTPDRSQGGLGIGLSVVKRLVEMHGGAVAVASEGDGRGTTVTIRLPRIDAPPRANPSGGGASTARRVLVVDDSTDAADSLAMLLELEGHEVATAYSASAALETAERLQPEVAFIDIGLPQMDGYEVARRLARERPLPRDQARGADGLRAARRPRRSAPRRASTTISSSPPTGEPSTPFSASRRLAQLAPRTGSGASAGSV